MSNKKSKDKRKKGLQKKNRKKNLKALKNISVKPINPTTIPTILEEEIKPVNPLSVPIIEKPKEDWNTSSLSILGAPGVMPIPDVGMNHNVMKQFKFFSKKSEEKKQKRRWHWLLRVLFLIGVIFLFYYFIFMKSEKKEILLTCTLKEYDKEENLDNISVLRYLFDKGILVRTIDEESIVFYNESMELYSSFEKSLKEWVEEEKDTYDNVKIEIQNRKNEIKVIYVVDLTADSNNPNNDLTELGYTYSELKKELIEEGYSCK